ncbi:DUF2218 domain-containing protein [Pararhizobium sp.]|uniref:DUF2218 domain-containing protein n=1 Tax=Pararhizobium sp. TaxID=1977563 RepID=UPI0027177F31|nr:DUF2218 domain-containing protein [Pararhizobium sp.]MDO9418129.1 DUF2218 domain-containing protein [Pararhizobium sp.]
MLLATTRFDTEHGQKYLVQLCKHFGHRIETSYSDDHGECHFEFGTAVFDADATGLNIAVNLIDEARLPQAQSVIVDHLMRFSFREKRDALDWQTVPQA